ncbi:tRNA (adenine(58)-N(1))-methyltransferase non-catalytic subunit trm6 [Rhodosporidiobolus nylandii]
MAEASQTAPAPSAEPTPSTSAAPAAATTPAASSSSSRANIRAGDNVLLKLPSGILRPVKINNNATGNISLGKYGSFKAKELVGRPYGHTYEVTEDGKLEVVKVTLKEIEETEANNEFIKSQGAQALTFAEIKALKESGLSGRDIIQKQIEEHKTFELKTEYSKEKYMKKKEAKYLQLFTPLEPTVHQITQYNFEKVPSKTRELRPDTLANMLAMANVRPGSRLLVVENIGGLIVAAAVERMAGQGRILVVNDADSPPDLHLVESFNFSASDLAPVQSVHWAATEESWTPPDLPLEVAETPDPTVEGGKRNTREASKLRKRRATFDKAKEARDEFFRGDFDGVIVATEYEPYSIIERLIPRLAGSCPIVVYSPHILFSALLPLRSHPAILVPTIHEPFLRQYQVLPGRTHPEMQGMASGGFVLTCLRVLENEAANAAAFGRKKRKGGNGERSAENAAKKAKVDVGAMAAGVADEAQEGTREEHGEAMKVDEPAAEEASAQAA